jgi:uncharacterized protein YndB with AHSA1/START domain
MDRPAFVYVTYIAAAPEQIWKALTNADFTQAYWGGRRIQSEWKVGSPVQHVREDGGIDWEGEVLQADAPRRLSYTFHMRISDAHQAERPSRVTFELDPMGSVVKLTLTHEDFAPTSSTFETTRHGWPAIISSLKSLLEMGAALPFPGLGFGPARKERPER